MRYVLTGFLFLTACSFAKPATYDILSGKLGAGAVIGTTSASLQAPPTGQVGVSLHVSADVLGVLTSPTWNFGDGSADETGVDATHTYTQAGSFTITLSGRDASNRLLSFTHVIEIRAADTSASCLGGLRVNTPAQIIVGKAAAYSLTVPACLTISKVEWDFGDASAVASGTSVSHTYGALGAFALNVKISLASGDVTLTQSLGVVSANLGDPGGPRDPNEEQADVPAPAYTGGWYAYAPTYCTGYAEYGALVTCFNIQLYCTGTVCGAQDGAVASCGFSYNQGAMDWRLNPALWENFTPGMDHLPRGWGCNVTRVDPMLSSVVFQPLWYLEKHADLRATFDPAAYDAGFQAAMHWLQYGANEGRQAAPAFWSIPYLARYADLRLAFGANGYAAAAKHYVQYGRAEGRKGL